MGVGVLEDENSRWDRQPSDQCRSYNRGEKKTKQNENEDSTGSNAEEKKKKKKTKKEMSQTSRDRRVLDVEDDPQEEDLD